MNNTRLFAHHKRYSVCPLQERFQRAVLFRFKYIYKNHGCVFDQITVIFRLPCVVEKDVFPFLPGLMSHLLGLLDNQDDDETALKLKELAFSCIASIGKCTALRWDLQLYLPCALLAATPYTIRGGTEVLLISACMHINTFLLLIFALSFFMLVTRSGIRLGFGSHIYI